MMNMTSLIAHLKGICAAPGTAHCQLAPNKVAKHTIENWATWVLAQQVTGDHLA